ncbi:hypothetical protein Vadar_025454 [Vaccinium darrowii]|uniref:Uncharacterized protein n=1 Tax=Vaccinium darrowii TaxID=229202 RepID=A0ACB7X3X6_9ERIC|nr:hypothetical protein Vadar_025454 [Vaccinium darrowii]
MLVLSVAELSSAIGLLPTKESIRITFLKIPSCFWMARPLFERILTQLQQHDNYFVQKSDAVGAAGISGIQKMTAIMRMLAYGMPVDSVDEYVKIGKSTAIESLMRFYRGVVEIFEPEYLRALNEAILPGSYVWPRIVDSLGC